MRNNLWKGIVSYHKDRNPVKKYNFSFASLSTYKKISRCIWCTTWRTARESTLSRWVRMLSIFPFQWISCWIPWLLTLCQITESNPIWSPDALCPPRPILTRWQVLPPQSDSQEAIWTPLDSTKGLEKEQNRIRHSLLPLSYSIVCPPHLKIYKCYKERDWTWSYCRKQSDILLFEIHVTAVKAFVWLGVFPLLSHGAWLHRRDPFKTWVP